MQDGYNPLVSFQNTTKKFSTPHSRADDEGSLDDLETREEAFLAAATAATSPPSPGQGRGDSRGRHYHPQLQVGLGSMLSNNSDMQNWSDLFFALDVMSGSIDICEILVFIRFLTCFSSSC